MIPMDDHLHDLAHFIAILLVAIFLVLTCILYHLYNIANPEHRLQLRSWRSLAKPLHRPPRVPMPAWLSAISIKVPSLRVILYPIIWARRWLWRHRHRLAAAGLGIVLLVATLFIPSLVEWGNGKFQVIVDNWPREQIGKILGTTGVDMTAKDKSFDPTTSRSKFIIEELEKETGQKVDPKYRPPKQQYQFEGGSN